MIETPDTIDVASLLAEAGLPREFRVTGLPGGGNNRVYRLDCGGSPFLLKAYFHHPDDPRDRLGCRVLLLPLRLGSRPALHPAAPGPR